MFQPKYRPLAESQTTPPENVDNDTAIHGGILLYKARALRRLKLPTAAARTAGAAVRRRKRRPPELICALRYERAIAYEDAGDSRRARAEWEKLYADAPSYRDVARRLRP